MASNTEIKWIDTSEIQPHCGNPRKDLGDLTELADSIKKNGIYQNLTVVPRTGGYTVVIGHRRLAAAKLAGVSPVPCIVRSMTEEEQIRTMLEENMQRSDLTPYEQAQGFQTLLDLGDSVSSIAAATGFSESTVRRRTQLLKLPQDKLQAADKRGGTLEDYAKLLQIDNEKRRNKCLEAVGTNNFDWQVSNALSDQEDIKWLQRNIAIADTFALNINELAKPPKVEYVTTYYSYTKKDIARPDGDDTTTYYYKAGSNWIIISREVDAPEETEEAEAQKTAEEKERRIREKTNAIDALQSRAYELRRKWITEKYRYLPDDLPAITAGLIAALSYADPEELSELTGIPLQWDDGEEKINLGALAGPDAVRNAKKILPLIPYAAFADSADWRCYDSRGNFDKNGHLTEIYKYLMALGYDPSDEEIQLIAGTHPLYKEEV